MRCHGLMLVRDEADILPESIPHYLSWIDGLFVMDLGSTDGTWDLLRDFASRDSRLVLHSTRDLVFHEGLRAILFDYYRNRFSAGDWIVKADADEFYDVPPPLFVQKYLRPRDTCIYVQWFYFRLTNLEIEAIEQNGVTPAQERSRPIAERRRFYKMPTHGEPRMFRYRPSMRWPARHAFPFNAGYVAPARIPVRHYPHRDPWQMAARYRLRSAMSTVLAGGPHWRLDDWRRDVLVVDERTRVSREQNTAGVGLAAVDAHTDDELRYWSKGERLAETGFSITHLSAPWRRLLQRAIHAGPLPWLDRLRSTYDRDYQPRSVPEAVRQKLSAPPLDPFGSPQFPAP